MRCRDIRLLRQLMGETTCEFDIVADCKRDCSWYYRLCEVPVREEISLILCALGRIISMKEGADETTRTSEAF